MQHGVGFASTSRGSETHPKQTTIMLEKFTQLENHNIDLHIVSPTNSHISPPDLTSAAYDPSSTMVCQQRSNIPELDYTDTDKVGYGVRQKNFGDSCRAAESAHAAP